MIKSSVASSVCSNSSRGTQEAVEHPPSSEHIKYLLGKLGYPVSQFSDKLIERIIKDLTLKQQQEDFEHITHSEDEELVDNDWNYVNSKSSREQTSASFQYNSDFEDSLIEPDYSKSHINTLPIAEDETEDFQPKQHISFAKSNQSLDQNHEEDEPFKKILDKLNDLDLSNLRNRVEIQKNALSNKKPSKKHISYAQDYTDDEIDDTTSIFSTGSSNLPWKSVYPGCKYYHTPFQTFLKTVIRTKIQENPKKKSDPVSRFHKHQTIWKKDTFLNRIESKTPSTTRFLQDHGPRMAGGGGGTGLVKSSSSSKIKASVWNTEANRPRHNLAAMRPNYVVPTSKMRNKLVWETRTRLAHIQD